MRKYKDNKGIVPRNLEMLVWSGETDSFTFQPLENDMSEVFCPIQSIVGNTIYSKAWYTFLRTGNVLYEYIKMQYKKKPFADDLVDTYRPPFYNYSPNYSDTLSMNAEIKDRVVATYIKNMYKYDKLWDAMTLEFNPLWNVDGVEETVRTLEKDGTIADVKSGSDETANTGTDTLAKTGTVSDAEGGSTALAHTGTITDTHTGTDTTVYTGSETDTTDYRGSETNSRNGSKTITESGEEVNYKFERTTDSLDPLEVSKDVKHYGSEDVTPSDRVTNEDYTNYNDSKSFTNRQDQTTKAFTNRQDQETKNLTDTTTLLNTDTTTHGKTNITTNNTTDTETHNTKETTTYGGRNTQTIDTLDTERVRLERHGNIGVTTTTKLLTELMEMATNPLMDFVDIVAKDILSTFTLSTY